MKFLTGRLALLLLFFANTLFAQQTDSIQVMLDSAFTKTLFSGNILITKNNKTIFEQSYGYADALNKIPLTAENSFQIASISKQFTAYGIMLLKNKGLLDYDSLVSKYIPRFPYRNITVRHLLTHTSGLPDFWSGIRPNMDTSKSNGNKEVLEYLISHPLPLQSVPGTKFTYCDIGYDFLATIIENISGLSYEVYLSKNIFKPLNMQHTFAYMVTDIRQINNKNLAIGHTYNTDTKKLAYAHLDPKYNFVFYLGNFYGDGSVVTTARDLAIWDKALKDCKLLPCTIQNESVEEYKYNGQTVSIKNNLNIGYGFGWFIKSTPGLGKTIYHSGGHPGNLHIIYRFPEKDITVIFLSNAETSNINAIRNSIIQLLR